GVPRLINILGETALVYAFADNRTQVDVETLKAVIADRQAAMGVTPPGPARASGIVSDGSGAIPLHAAASSSRRTRHRAHPASAIGHAGMVVGAKPESDADDAAADRALLKDMFSSLRDR
ncbi:MAG: hypothetical protein KDK91_28020, partial [Gammaproteobacteria bacterium]|nr:hypothetical protein [Gammaproteobacteria bacterium]